MMRTDLLVLVANGVQARVLRGTSDLDDLRTCLTIEDGPARPEARSEPGADRRREERIHHFVSVLSAHLRELLRQYPAYGVVLVAPTRILRQLQAEMAPSGAVRATVSKDLVKLDDAELARRLVVVLPQAGGGFAAA